MKNKYCVSLLSLLMTVALVGCAGTEREDGAYMDMDTPTVDYVENLNVEDAPHQDSFLNQPTTEYNWRQGLPSGFSEKVDVYNKVGWDWNGKSWNIYNDAAILNFRDEGRQFIVVVMTSGVRYQQIRDFGAQIEKAFYDQNVLKN